MKAGSLALVLFMGLGVAGSLGCGSKEGSGAGPQSSAAPGGKPGAAPAGGAAGEVDPACTAFENRTDDSADRVIAWKPGVGSTAERCMKIKVGQSVTFEGEFGKHPMKTAKGDSPSPISEVRANISNPGVPNEERSMATFNKPGTFGYVCEKDPTMKGAIQVVP